ncbi:MAG TPA: PilZ domain-containing protein [Erythrobacter sp.]|nr:PilZ domain-containing protein [Erythrobacter sp.]
MDGVESTRSSDRKRLDLLVQGRLRSRALYVEVIDVSEGGCKIKGRHGFAEVDELVSLRIDGVRTPLGRIVWVDGKYAGVAFDGKMHPAVIEHLYRERVARKQAPGGREKAA